MKLLIAASLLTIAFVPTVAANHDVCPSYSACVSTYSVGSGDCNTTTGYEYTYNNVNVFSYTPGVAYAGAGAYTSCYDYNFWGYSFEGSTIGAGAFASTPAGYAASGAYWYSYGGSFGSYCNSYAYVYGSGLPFLVQYLGCPAGAPPKVTQTLP